MRRLRSEERGGTLVETAVVLLLFMSVMFGLIEVGRLVLTYVSLSDAVRAGERYAIVHGYDRTGTGADGPSGPSPTYTQSQVVGVVQNVTTAAGLATANLTVNVVYPSSNAVGSLVQVNGSYNYTPMLFFFPFNMTLSSTAEGMICY